MFEECRQYHAIFYLYIYIDTLKVGGAHHDLFLKGLRELCYHADG